MYHLIIKQILFLFSPEKAHALTVSLFSICCKTPLLKNWLQFIYGVNNKKLARKVMGIDFPNPVGLAAGFDKDGKYYDVMSNLGFGFIEIGTVTPLAQSGNPKPRLFRLPADEALINRMGFNNDGVEALVSRLKNRKNNAIIIGGNIGKNKVTPNEIADADYVKCFEALHPHVDYFVVNVSSPNTPNLRALQDKEPLTKLLAELKHLNTQKASQKPILLKIAPDLTDEQLVDIVDIINEVNIEGVIASNTTISRADLKTSNSMIEEIGAGGLSGKPVRDKSTAIIKYLRTHLSKDKVIIGVGGVDSPASAIEKLKAGADLIQVYTGLVYQGPTLIKNINKAILANNL